MKVLNKHELRNDVTGAGHFGAPRVGYRHQGVDIISQENEPVFAPFAGTVRNGITASYQTDRKLVEIKNESIKVKLMYVRGNKPTGYKAREGEIIGYAQDTGKLYNSSLMKSHVHVELYENNLLKDPTKKLFNENTKKK